MTEKLQGLDGRQVSVEDEAPVGAGSEAGRRALVDAFITAVEG